MWDSCLLIIGLQCRVLHKRYALRLPGIRVVGGCNLFFNDNQLHFFSICSKIVNEVCVYIKLMNMCNDFALGKAQQGSTGVMVFHNLASLI